MTDMDRLMYAVLKVVLKIDEADVKALAVLVARYQDVDKCDGSLRSENWVSVAAFSRGLQVLFQSKDELLKLFPTGQWTEDVG